MYRMYGLRGSPGRSWLRKENKEVSEMVGTI